jgi:hypothetical protein
MFLAVLVLCTCRANRHVTAFAALLCLLACSNSLFVPLHLEDVVLTHPRTAAMQAVGRLPQLWGSASDLGGISSQLQDGSLNMTLSFVTNEALTNLLRGKRPGLWRLGNRPVMSMPAPAAGAERSSRLLGEGALETGLGEAALTNRLDQAAAASSKQLSSFAAWMGAVERGPWRDNSTWAAVAVAGLQQGLSDYMGQCSDAHRFQHNAWKHHYDIFRMQVGGKATPRMACLCNSFLAGMLLLGSAVVGQCCGSDEVCSSWLPCVWLDVSGFLF